MREYEIKIPIGEKTVPITVKLSSVQNISMHFDGESFIITAPLFYTEENVWQFVEKHKRWIKNRCDKLEPSTEKSEKLDNSVAYLGKKYRLIISDGSPGVVISDDEIIVFTPGGDREKAKTIFIKFWKEKALTFFTAKTEYFYKLYGRFLCVPCMPKVEIVRVKGYWGQCAPTKRLIKYNMYALQFGEKYCDYLVCHELTHFRYQNHGRFFHSTLNKVLPGEKEIAKTRKLRDAKMWFDL